MNMKRETERITRSVTVQFSWFTLKYTNELILLITVKNKFRVGQEKRNKP